MGKYNMFSDLRSPRDVTGYTLYRGTTDWTQLQQFDLFEMGYPYLILVSTPKFLTAMAKADPEVATLVNSYRHIIEYEFTGFDSGIDDISTDALEISNEMQSINVIGKTTAPGGTTFSMNYKERAGGTLSKMHELYLRSVRDPASGFKTYNGLIGTGDGQIRPEDITFQDETWSFLYMHTDPTGLELEQSIYWIGCWPTSANLSQYTSNKRGDIAFSEVSVEFNGFPLRGSAINRKAKEILDWMNSSSNKLMIHRNSWDYEYAGITDTDTGLGQSSLTANI